MSSSLTVELLSYNAEAQKMSTGANLGHKYVCQINHLFLFFYFNLITGVINQTCCYLLHLLFIVIACHYRLVYILMK